MTDEATSDDDLDYVGPDEFEDGDPADLPDVGVEFDDDAEVEAQDGDA